MCLKGRVPRVVLGFSQIAVLLICLLLLLFESYNERCQKVRDVQTGVFCSKADRCYSAECSLKAHLHGWYCFVTMDTQQQFSLWYTETRCELTYSRHCFLHRGEKHRKAAEGCNQEVGGLLQEQHRHWETWVTSSNKSCSPTCFLGN